MSRLDGGTQDWHGVRKMSYYNWGIWEESYYILTEEWASQRKKDNCLWRVSCVSWSCIHPASSKPFSSSILRLNFWYYHLPRHSHFFISITNHWDLRILCVLMHAQSCSTLCDPMDCSPPGSSVHGIFQEEYWSGLSFPPPGHIPTQGLNLHLLHLLHWQAGSTSPIFTLSSTLNTAIGTYPGSRFLYLLWTMAINFYLVPLPPVLFPNEQLPIAVQWLKIIITPCIFYLKFYNDSPSSPPIIKA